MNKKKRVHIVIMSLAQRGDQQGEGDGPRARPGGRRAGRRRRHLPLSQSRSDAALTHIGIEMYHFSGAGSVVGRVGHAKAERQLARMLGRTWTESLGLYLLPLSRPPAPVPMGIPSEMHVHMTWCRRGQSDMISLFSTMGEDNTTAAPPLYRRTEEDTCGDIIITEGTTATTARKNSPKP